MELANHAEINRELQIDCLSNRLESLLFFRLLFCKDEQIGYTKYQLLMLVSSNYLPGPPKRGLEMAF